MTSMRVLAISVSLCICMVGCDSKKPASQGESKEVKSIAELEAARGKSIEEGEKRLYDQAVERMENNKVLLERHYEVLLVSVRHCGFKAQGAYLDTGCEQYKRFTQARGKFNKSIVNPNAMWMTLAQKHLTHEATPVRLLSARLMTLLSGAEPAVQKKLQEAFEVEKSPQVKSVILRSLRTWVGKSDVVAAIMLKGSRDESPEVRKDAALGISSMWARGTQGMLERVKEMMSSDPSDEVRAALCESMGKQANDALLPLFEAQTTWPPKNQDVYEGCFKGLMHMWSDSQVAKIPSQKAYTLTLERLGEVPRTKERPPRGVAKLLNRGIKREFLSKAPWFVAKDVRDVMVEIISDKDAHPLLRQDSVDMVESMEGGKKALEVLYRKRFGGKATDKGEALVKGQIGAAIQPVKEK